MAPTSLLRSALCILRRQTSLYNHTFQCTTRFSFARLSNVLSVAKYSSDNDRLPDIQQFSMQPKTKDRSRGLEKFRPRGLEKKEILQEVEELSSYHPDYVLPSQRKREYEDILFIKIARSENADEIFYLYKQHSDVMSSSHLLRAMKVLNILVIKGYEKVWELQEVEEFQDMCQRLLKSSRRMEVHELLLLLQYLCRLEVDVDSKLVQTILQLLRHGVNDLGLRDIVQLEFLLRKLRTSSLSEGLLIAIPLLLENALNREPLHGLSLTQLSKLLLLCIHSRNNGTGQVIQEIYKRGSIQSGKMSQSILWTLLEIYNSKGGRQIALTKDDTLTREILVKECLEVVARNSYMFSVNEIQTTLMKINLAYENQDWSSYNEHFLNSVAVQCIEKGLDFTKSSHIVRRLLKLNYVSEDLLNHVVSTILQDSENVVDTDGVITHLVTAITATSDSNVNHLEALKILLTHKSMIYDSEHCLSIPAVSLALDLLSMGYYHERLLEIVTSADFLSLYVVTYAKRNITDKKLLQLNQVLTLIEKSSLRVPEEFVKDARVLIEDRLPTDSELYIRLLQIYKNSDLVVSGVLTDDDLYIEHLIVMDEDNNPVNVKENVTSENGIRISDLNIPEHCKRVAIVDVKSSQTYEPKHIMKVFVRVHQQLLGASGFVVVPVLQFLVNQLAVDEKNLYIKNLIENEGR